MGKDVIIALDFDSKEKTLAFLDRFTGEKPFVKIGMELFYAEGPAIVREIKARGHKIFLDLKLHDIPNTVKKAMAVLSSLDVDMVNLHASGTRAMMSAALEGLTRADGTRPMLIAVTQLTSTSQQSMEEEIEIHKPLADVVIDYAKNAKLAGLDGVVCSCLLYTSPAQGRQAAKPPRGITDRRTARRAVRLLVLSRLLCQNRLPFSSKTIGCASVRIFTFAMFFASRSSASEIHISLSCSVFTMRTIFALLRSWQRQA